MTWTTPKTDWTTGELVTAADINAIGENLAALRHPSTAVAAYTTTANINSRSTNSFVDVDSDNLSLTITTGGGDVLVHFDGYQYTSREWYGYYDFTVDGSRQGGNEGLMGIGSNQASMLDCVSFTRLIHGLSAGSHTFVLQWKGAVQLKAGAQFWVREI